MFIYNYFGSIAEFLWDHVANLTHSAPLEVIVDSWIVTKIRNRRSKKNINEPVQLELLRNLLLMGVKVTLMQDDLWLYFICPL